MKKILILLFFLFFILVRPINLLAHPGRTDSSGGHTCKTNCEDWGLNYGEYHYHNGGGSSSTTTTTPTPTYQPKIEYKNETKTEEIPFETKYENDSNLEEGQSKVKQEGVKGVKTIIYKVTYTDGAETNREKTSEEVTTKPVDKIVIKGTKSKPSEPPKVKSETSTGDTILGFLVLSGIGYGIYRLYKKFKLKNKNEK